jgi:hypothetical protein
MIPVHRIQYTVGAEIARRHLDAYVEERGSFRA